MPNYIRGQILIIIPVITLLVSMVWFLTLPTKTEAGDNLDSSKKESVINQEKTQVRGNYVLVHLNTNTVEIKNGTNTIKTLPIVSQGKPGSYYETIGGEYSTNYKEALHFSSIGHVYMPYSIHVFGNYFIHGIPYYPDGTKVSSTYSGGCIRLADNDAEYIYNFITRDTPIIVTRGNEDDFAPTATTTHKITHETMTRLMIATISLEVLTQDNEIIDTDNISITTRKKLLPQLLTTKDLKISTLYRDIMNESAFTELMNAKAKTLGLTNTVFINTTSPAITTEEDYRKFMDYIKTYKSYLLQF